MFSGQNRCRICGAVISDDNPDGIGSQCRAVWKKATTATAHHFRGLDLWKAKTKFWADLFIEEYRNTKFRSQFRKGFFTTIATMQKSGEYRITKKMLEIIKNMLVGMGGKIQYERVKEVDEAAKAIARGFYENFIQTMTDEEKDYRINMAKKFYGEASHNKSLNKGVKIWK